MTYDILVPAVVIISSIILGMIVEKFTYKQLMKIAAKTAFKTDDIIVSAFKGMILLWFTLTGVHISLNSVFRDDAWMHKATMIIVSIAILSVTIVIMRIATGLINNYRQDSEAVIPSITIFSNLTKLLILIIGVLVMLEYLGISITPMLTALGVGGIAVALALQDTLSSMFAGIHILISRQIKPGDYIKLDSGQEGFVTDINWRNTSIRMMSNNMVLIPNLKLSSAIVTNYELPEHEMAVTVNVGVGYSSDLEMVERTVCEVAREVLQEVPGAVADYEPFVRFHAFSDSSIDLTVFLRTKSFTDQYLLKHQFIKSLHRRFNEVGIEIPFPIRTVYLQQDESNQ